METFVVKILLSLLIIVLMTSSVVTEKLSLGEKNGKRKTLYITCEIQEFFFYRIYRLKFQIEMGKTLSNSPRNESKSLYRFLTFYLSYHFYCNWVVILDLISFSLAFIFRLLFQYYCVLFIQGREHKYFPDSTFLDN